MRLLRGICVFAAALVVCGAAGAGRAADAGANTGARPRVHGSFTTDYTFSATGGEDDHEGRSLLSLTVGDPALHPLSAALLGGGIFDLDGSNRDGRLADIYDTFSSRAVGRLYYAYLHARPSGLLDHVRVGRQYLFHLEGLHFDGLSAETRPYAGFVLGAFGGVPVHLFETQSGFDAGDWTAGGWLQWTPVSRLRLRFDYTHLRDAASGFRVTTGDLDDDLFGGSVWFDLSPSVSLYSRITAFADRMRDFELATTWRVPERDLVLRVALYRLLEGYDIRVLDWDAFGLAGTYQPFTQVNASVTKRLGRHVTVDGGVDVRWLDATQAASAFNHGYERVYLTVATRSLGVRGLDLSLTGDYYHGEDNTLRNNSAGVSFAASQALWRDRLKLTAGTAHYLYRYNLLAGAESDNVRTWFGDIELRPVKPLRIRIGYEFEDNDIGDFHRVRTRATWTF